MTTDRSSHRHDRRLRRALSALVGLAVACRTPATQIQLVMDSDADPARAMSVEVIAFEGSVAPSALAARSLDRTDGIYRFERSSDGTGALRLPGSVGIVPPANWLESAAADRAVVTLWIRSTFAATSRAPEVRSDRVVRAPFTRNRASLARVFLPLRCGDLSVGCVSVVASQCTVSVRCREQNATCGDQGECVSPDLALDGDGGAPLVDATTGRTLDAADVTDVTDVADVATTDDADARADDATSDSGLDAIDPTDASDVVDTDATDAADATDAMDAMDAMDAPDVPDVLEPCPSGRTRCGGVCTDLTTSVDHCGACDLACPSTANATPVCVRSMCGVVCDPGFVLLAGRCIAATVTPRPITPLSLGETTLLRPTFQWALPAPLDGAVLELCRDRGCTSIITSIAATGTSARPTSPLPARSVIFWRLRGRIGAAESTITSATWLFHTPAVDASSGVDSSSVAHNDLNGDGFDDVVVGAPNAAPGGRATAGTAHVFMGYPPGVTPVAMRTLEGERPGDNFGFAVAGAGDLNGDGFGDLVIGAYNADPGGRTDAGAAWVYYGTPTGIAATAARVLEGVAASDLFAYSVASAGDVDRDGYGDLLIGSNSGSLAGVTNGGTASIYRGSSAGISAEPTIVLGGATMGDGFGVSVASAGDANGDGYSDVIVGAWSAALPGRPNGGSASIFHGGAMGLSSTAALVLEAAADGDYFGRTIAGAGDVNNDGYSDVLVGAYYADFMGRSDAGTTSVYHGSAAGISPIAARLIAGGAIQDYLGISTSSAGDLNGDGFDDVVIGAYFADPGGRNRAGHTQVFYGSATGIAAAADLVIEGVAANDFLGVAMSPAGDVNGDGFGDVLIGAYQADPMGRANAGTAQLHFGSAAGITAIPSITLSGVNAGDGFGYGLARLSIERDSDQPAIYGRNTNTRRAFLSVGSSGAVVRECNVLASASWPRGSLRRARFARRCHQLHAGSASDVSERCAQ